MTDKNNMELWDAVCTTAPSDTKRVTQRGGFTAICAQSQIKAATKQWGPYGKAWGLQALEWGEIRNAAGELIEVTLQADFIFPGGGLFPISSDAKWTAGQDCRKKLQTDVTTKALSKLGFNADVFLGRYDDNKYVEERQAEERGQQPPEQPAPQQQAATAPENAEAFAINAIKKKMFDIFGKEECIAAKARVIDSAGNFIGTEGEIKTLAEAQAFENILNKGADQ